MGTFGLRRGRFQGRVAGFCVVVRALSCSSSMSMSTDPSDVHVHVPMSMSTDPSELGAHAEADPSLGYLCTRSLHVLDV